MKKIYHVTVQNEYYCVAENETEAEEIADEARSNFFDWNTYASEVHSTNIPKEWLDGLTYGVEKDITLKDWIADREKEETEKKNQEELDSLQMKLPLLG